MVGMMQTDPEKWARIDAKRRPHDFYSEFMPYICIDCEAVYLLPAIQAIEPVCPHCGSTDAVIGEYYPE